MIALAAPIDRIRGGAGQRQLGLAITHVRLMLVMLLFLAATALIAGRLVLLTILNAHGEAGPSVSALIPPRADIVDRNGVPLAQTIRSWSIAIHPSKLLNRPQDLAPKLAQLMPEHDEAYYLRILRSGKPFFFLRRRALPELVARVNALGEPAFEFQRDPERLYPQTTLASHVLGFINIDGRGVQGIEGAFNKQLTDPATRNHAVALSIDTRVQSAMEFELSAAMQKFSAIGGAGIVLDVQTGEVIALTSLPTFNPNAVGQSPPEALYNRATMGTYELGSTFKAITAAAGMESGVIKSMSKRYDATHPLHIGGYTIHDDHPQSRFLDVPEMMVYSSNIVTAQIADQVGEHNMKAMFNRLGFGTKTDVEINEKERPQWPKYWGRTTVMTVGYGHGIAVTPLHLANAYAALVNGGIWRPATLLKRNPDQVPAGRRVISPETSYRVRQLLRLVVLKGTGRKADAPGYRVGGKTGSGDKADAGGYDRHNIVATFAGVFPMDAPRYVVVAMLDSPKGIAETFGHHEAAWNTGPVVSKVISRIGPMLGVMPDEAKDIDESDMLPLLWSPKSGVVKADAAD